MPTQPPIQHVPQGSVFSSARKEEPTEEEIQEKPWKYIGYKGYTNFISSDDDFFVLRRFDSLNVRAALALQDELSWLEEELGVLDNEFSAKAADDFNNGTLRQDVFASAVIIAIGVLMLITPIWILQALTDLKAKLAVITVFIFVFLLVLSLAMVAKPFEALGATAAYAAVLMVFLQIQSGDS
ncbi:hypothetical protein CTAM01_08360 [Colletotrichum tamarilloi]|uniref:DUF6594 domain-containing protein n=1 Tax=Colletotrichum tamarilloi TaxID=1209934 RepID=A0ABQ9R691_9PEZI|nr:uncharacterized protein CTAM01_08360 [Colletotrichum tamarilloi]KAK1496173.1 hypothetical protein CTAM01_08360 [Colletotrichum tamarilloi]